MSFNSGYGHQRQYLSSNIDRHNIDLDRVRRRDHDEFNDKENASGDDEDDDKTFKPPALSSYAMSLLSELSNKAIVSNAPITVTTTTTTTAAPISTARSTTRSDSNDSESEQHKRYDFQPRLSGITGEGRNMTHERTSGSTVETKMTSYNKTGTVTPYTAFMGNNPHHDFHQGHENDDDQMEDKMEVSPIDQNRFDAFKSQVRFDTNSPRSVTPIATHKMKKMPLSSSNFSTRTSALFDLNRKANQRRFARVSLGAPKRVAVVESNEGDQVQNQEEGQSLQWFEEEKKRVHEKNAELMEAISHADKNKPLLNDTNDKENYPSDGVRAERKVLSSIPLNVLENARPSPEEHRHKSATHERKEIKKTSPIKFKKSSSFITVNNIEYQGLELLGSGGSSKVYKAKNPTNGKVCAIKQVFFDDFDDNAIMGFKGEISLLKKLSHDDRVVKLLDYEMNDENGGGPLMLVMECGEIDLARVLQSRLNMPLDISFVRYHFIEMLKCVRAVHKAGIVHSDLKPANFLFVKGVLKIIDFGIANALSDHTVNVYRDSQVGTPNYMSPESLLESNPMINSTNSSNPTGATWKVGRAADIWSCGCILYQMIYGRPPYAIYSGSQRLLAIMNPQVKVVYNETGLGGVKVPTNVIDLIKNCLLQRDPKKRWMIDQILTKSEFCNPRFVSKAFIQDLVANAINFGTKHGDIAQDSLDQLTDEVWSKIEELNI